MEETCTLPRIPGTGTLQQRGQELHATGSNVPKELDRPRHPAGWSEGNGGPLGGPSCRRPRNPVRDHVNSSPPARRWFRVTARSRIDRPCGRFRHVEIIVCLGGVLLDIAFPHLIGHIAARRHPIPCGCLACSSPSRRSKPRTLPSPKGEGFTDPLRRTLNEILPGIANRSIQLVADLTPPAWVARHRPTGPNNVHLAILIRLGILILGRGLSRSGKLLILRLTPRKLRRL